MIMEGFSVLESPSPQSVLKVASKRGIVRGAESIESALRRAASSLAEMDSGLSQESDGSGFQRLLESAILEGVLIPGTPILSKAGRRDAPLGACTVGIVPGTSGHVDCLRFSHEIWPPILNGLGTGFDLSTFEDPVRALNDVNAVLYDLDGRLRDRNLRPSATMATVDASHPRVLDFIRAKMHADFQLWRANISIAFRGSPDTIDLRLNELVDEIAASAHYCGEPGGLFMDRFEEDNPTPSNRYASTAPCAEVALAEGEQCHFAYLNLDRMVSDGQVDWKLLSSTARLAVRTLDDAIEWTIKAGCDGIVSQKRRIGVGATGFHSMLIRLGIPYASEEAVQLASRISEAIAFESYSESCYLATLRGAFPLLVSSRWTDPEWVLRNVRRQNTYVSKTAWEELAERILDKGVRNASLVAFPPAGNSSEILGVSKAIEPAVNLDETRASVKCFLDAGGKESSPVLTTSFAVPPEYHLKIAAAFQSFADDSVSKTVNVSRSTSRDHIRSLFLAARNMGLKGVSVFRDGCLAERGAGTKEV